MKIFLINSTPNALQAVNKSLENTGFSVESIDGFDGALEGIKDHDADLAIINWGKEDYDIEGLCRRIKRLKNRNYISVLIIAGRDREKEIHRAIDAGADDFIFRPFSGDELAMRVSRARKIILLEEKVSKSKKHLMKLAKEDPLTNLLNRRAILDEALNEMGRAARDRNYISSIMINISNLQSVIEQHGAEESGNVLADISGRMKLSCRPYDKIGRFDLTDFIIILPDAEVKNARKVAERIMKSITGKPFLVNNEKVHLSLAIGVSEMDPNDVIMVQEKHSDDLLMNDLLLDSLIKRSIKGVEKAASKGVNRIEVVSE